MMSQLLLPAALALLAAIWLARPFLRRGDVELGETEQAVSFYRVQLLELARNREEGLLDEAARREAAREIEGRALRAARDFSGGLAVARSAPVAAIGAAVVTIAFAAGIYAELGAPGLPDQPLETRREAALTARAEAGDARARALLAIRALSEKPDGLDKFWALGQAHSRLGDHASAAEAYRRAAEASDDDPAVLSAYAEALTLANGNKVPPAAEIIVGQILAKNPYDPRARYYAALAKAQAQDFEGAMADWLALYNTSPPDAPWAARVRQDIISMARFSSTDLASVLPDATQAERRLAESAPAGEAVPEERITSLRARLAGGERDWQASLELAGLLAAEGGEEEALSVLDAVARAYRDAPFVAEQIAAARREIAGRRGPNPQQVAAAGEMTKDDRDAMIEGMVEGLATRLAEHPQDPEGWAMLVRSYAVLQHADRARSALTDGLAALGADTPEGRKLTAIAIEHGL
ncbi:MAG: c-type cytochrome biogenesis protein CcmI [Pseudomonadota bacterium]